MIENGKFRLKLEVATEGKHIVAITLSIAVIVLMVIFLILLHR